MSETFSEGPTEVLQTADGIQDMQGQARDTLAGEERQEMIGRQVMELFTPTAEHFASERLLDSRLAELAEEFLRAPDAGQQPCRDEIQGLFSSTIIHEEPMTPEIYVEDLLRRLVAKSSHTASPRFVGHMTSALPSFVRPLGQLMTALNQNVVKVETSSALSLVERQVLGMLHQLIWGDPKEVYLKGLHHSEQTFGMVTSGGTVANLTAMWCARNAVFRPEGDFAGIEAEGWGAALAHTGYRGAVIVGPSSMHYSFAKAADVLGLGTQGLVGTPLDDRGRADVEALRRTVDDCKARGLKVLALVGVAGSTDCGAVDPLEAMADLAEDKGIHFHVDAAWGGPVLFSKQHRSLLAGIERADSVTVDGHKQLYLPMGIGLLLLRSPSLAAVIEKEAQYIIRRGSADLGRRSLEGSRPGRSLLLHAGLHLLGLDGYGYLIDEGIRKTRYLAERAKASQAFELLMDPMINLVVYRYIPTALQQKVASGDPLTLLENQEIDRVNEWLQTAQWTAGRTFTSRTRVALTHHGTGPVVALRAVIANPLTTEADIDAVLADQETIGREVEGGPRPSQYGAETSVESDV